VSTGNTVVVTGSSSGLGKATKELLESDGVRVIGVDLDGADVIADLSQPAGRALAVDEIAEASGGVVDGYVGYAGVGPIISDIGLLTSVNYFGQIDLLVAVKPLLAAAAKPAVVVVSSIAPMVQAVDDESLKAMLAGDEPHAVELTNKHGDHGVAYNTSKLATLKFGRSIAPAWIADGIRVNVLAPGTTVTPMTEVAMANAEIAALMDENPAPIARWAQPPDIAEAARWLLSEASGYVVGSVLVVDGGIDAAARPDSY
jgi:NAD(P)-dependent dehydrogenase (short-subunit alcohol dehydrogenase family)